MKNAMIFIVTALLLAACGTPATPPPPSPTVTRAPTTIPTSTVQPTLPPTATRAATFTPLPPTAPFYYSLPTFTPTPFGTPAVALQCSLVSASVVDETEFKPREPFEPGWQITNTGTAPWIPGNVDFAYIAGTKMHKYSPVALMNSVQPGDTTVVSVAMSAPKVEGTYKEILSLRRGTDYFCHVSVKITVVP
jgi:hypothetical protein